MPKKAAHKPHKKKIPHHYNFKKFFVFISVVAITWGVWNLISLALSFITSPLLGALVAIIVPLVYLMWDDFHLKELE